MAGKKPSFLAERGLPGKGKTTPKISHRLLELYRLKKIFKSY